MNRWTDKSKITNHIMGYTLKTFLCKQQDAVQLTKNFDTAFQINLDQNLCLIPMTDDLFDQMNENADTTPLGGFVYFNETIEDKIVVMIKNIKMAYVEAEYFGGQGGQSAIVWDNGKRVKILGFGKNIINQVLQDFEVVTINDKDEFDTLSLGRYRDTENWVEKFI